MKKFQTQKFTCDKKLFLSIFTIAVFLFSYTSVIGETISKEERPEPRLYEFHNNTFDEDLNEEIYGFTYGKSSLGSLVINGDFYDKARERDDNMAYAVKGEFSIGYNYNGEFQNDNKDSWNLVNDDKSKYLEYYPLSKKIKSGVILIFRYSPEEDDFALVAEYYDFFKKNKKGKLNLYTATNEETSGGVFYKVMVGYKMGKATGAHQNGWNVPIVNHEIGGKDEYEYINCYETYEFWVHNDDPTVELKDLKDGRTITTNTSVDSGFAVRRTNATTEIKVSYAGETDLIESANITQYTDPGKYNITTTTVFGDTTKTISVKEGIVLSELKPSVFLSKKNTGFVNGEQLDDDDAENMRITKLYIGSNQIMDISRFNKSGTDAYAITGSNAAIYLQYLYGDDDMNESYQFIYDKWGAKEKEKIYGVNTGEIGTGALIVQTSKDGVNWTHPNNGRYSSGLYTKDMLKHYGDGQNILIYTPNGKDVIDGIYVRICYVYQTKYDGGFFDKETFDTLEEYKFYLCSNELDAVTFQNLTLSNGLQDSHVDEDNNSSAAYKLAETLTDGSMTVTGFTINKELNPNVDCVVKRNGESVSLPSDNTFKRSGKYTIELKNATGEKKTTTIYVDTSSNQIAMSNYFGDSFIEGKRIYSFNEYPTFEAGDLFYHIAAKTEEMPNMQGTIENLTTGKKISIIAKNIEQTGKITDPGEYEAVFRIGKTAGSNSNDKASGDYRKFTFHFTVIKEGTSPGPQVNKEVLTTHVGLTASDYYPIYYGVTYPSAGPGNITVAFADRDSAIQYAAAYEQGVVEKQDNGTYRYRGSLNITQKEEYRDLWALTDATDFFAEQAVERLYFDVSDRFTICTLPEDILETTKNLRTLELKNSIVVFPKEDSENSKQRDLLCDKGGIPLINDKKMIYLSPGMDGILTTKELPVEFIKDKYGYDSKSVILTDSEGHQYSLDYRKSVEKQLSANNCPSGIVKIQEENIYGETTSYEALYIANGDNKTKIKISYVDNGKSNTISFSDAEDGKIISASEFTIENITDELDPHSLVIVESKGKKEAFAANEPVNANFKDKGEYKITAVNRMGYKFTFTITTK